MGAYATAEQTIASRGTVLAHRAAGLLALTALIALRSRWSIALPIVWVFDVVGTADLINALRQADAVPDLGATWYIPTFFVPLLLVTHYLIFARLLQHSPTLLNQQHHIK